MKTFIALIDKLNDRQGKILSFLVLAATLQVCFELFLRYAFNAPTAWGLEVTIYLCALTYVFSGAYVKRSDSHLKVDLIHILLPRKITAWLDVVVGYPVFFFFAAILTWRSGIWALEAMQRGTTSGTFWDPPVWPMRLALFLGSLLLLLQGVANLLRDIEAMRKGRRSA